MKNENKLFYILLSLAILGLLSLLIPFIILSIKDFSGNENKSEKEQKKEPILLFILIDRDPDKLQYKEGEMFDDTGLILRAFYEDGTYPQIFDYKIESKGPLTIYNNSISIIYKENICEIAIEIINDDNIRIIRNYAWEKYTLSIAKNYITRFEIEDADISLWGFNNNNNIISRDDASRKTFLSGLEKGIYNYNTQLSFNFTLDFDAEIEISVSYVQKEEYKNYEYDISLIYSFIIDGNQTIEIDEKEKFLNPRQSTTNWQLITYKSFTIKKGNYNMILKLLPGDKEIGTPNIDYIDFKAFEINKQPEPEIIIPPNDFHTVFQYLYINDPDPINIYKYADGNYELSKPKGNILDFSDSINITFDSYIIEFSENINFENSKKVFNLPEKKYNLKNLKLGQKIYYRGSTSEIDLKQSKIYEIIVNDKGPRNLDIPGVSNCRDIGGYRTYLIDNGIIKQGLFYRSAQLNNIKNEGKEIVTKNLGIKVEIDLREKYMNTGPYITGVKYYPVSIEYQQFEGLEEQYYKVFSLISQADINPIILHCAAGADRTGIMSFALLTLLGCDYNDIARDYLFTNFANEGFRDINNEFNVWWEKLNFYEGNTKAEQCKNWLISKGLEENKLENIRRIFIDGYKGK